MNRTNIRQRIDMISPPAFFRMVRNRYTRELNLDKNTHLITDTPQGAKFELASSSNPPVIHIVTASWVNSTAESGRRAQEEDHNLLDFTINNSQAHENVPTTFSGNQTTLSLANNALLQGNLNLSRSLLFKSQQFYLIGFEDNPELKQKISKLIRRGNGTIYWDLNGNITTLIVCDECDDALRNAAKVITLNHSNVPPMVSPLWVIDSYKRGLLQSASSYRPTKSSESNGDDNDIKLTTKATKKPKTSLSSTTSNVSIFRGCLFSLVRSSTLIEHGKSAVETNDHVDFDAKELEDLIKTHGGQMLSNKLLGALRADVENTDGKSKRKCHVVCWGESPPRLSTNPLISQLERHNLCEIILVTPIWLQACVSARKRIKPDRLPLVLMPQSWSMKSLLNKFSPQSKREAQRQKMLEIALTGFQGTEKLVVVHLIEAMGGVYHENMSNANTHLVFKKSPNGLKLEKALEWGLHVVSIQWLYHVVRHGYCGEHQEEGGCEKRFSFREESQ